MGNIHYTGCDTAIGRNSRFNITQINETTKIVFGINNLRYNVFLWLHLENFVGHLSAMTGDAVREHGRRNMVSFLWSEEYGELFVGRGIR